MSRTGKPIEIESRLVVVRGLRGRVITNGYGADIGGDKCSNTECAVGCTML